MQIVSGMSGRACAAAMMAVILPLSSAWAADIHLAEGTEFPVRLDALEFASVRDYSRPALRAGAVERGRAWRIGTGPRWSNPSMAG